MSEVTVTEVTMSEEIETEVINPKDVRFSAMDLLSRREHLRSELETKLLKRFADAAIVADTLAALKAENLQCDQRYCDSYVHQRSGRGYGPLRIRQELRHKGASVDCISLAMETCETDWHELARLTRHKKFGRELPADYTEMSRQLRFLQYRGFGGDYTGGLFNTD
jgi:regulatory protein